MILPRTVRKVKPVTITNGSVGYTRILSSVYPRNFRCGTIVYRDSNAITKDRGKKEITKIEKTFLFIFFYFYFFFSFLFFLFLESILRHSRLYSFEGKKFRLHRISDIESHRALPFGAFLYLLVYFLFFFSLCSFFSVLFFFFRTMTELLLRTSIRKSFDRTVAMHLIYKIRHFYSSSIAT